jgi:predicted RNA binding protein YcfA (HicA-like mRNA interferase family)
MPMTSKQMITYLKKNGFEPISQNGSHVKMYHSITGKTVIVPYHCKDLKLGLEQRILKEAGLK